MTEIHLTILFFGVFIVVFTLVAIWAVKLYIKNKRADIGSDDQVILEDRDHDYDDERSYTRNDEFLMPGGRSYIHRHDNDPWQK